MTKFDFYLNNLSFKQPDDLTIEQLREKIEQLAIDCEFIRNHNEAIHRHNSIYEENVWEDWDLTNMYNPEFQEMIGRDYQYLLPTIIDQSVHTDLENELIILYLEEHTSEQVNGLLCLHEITGINPKFCIYNKNNWFAFHRHFLGTYPIDENNYVSGCKIYFPKLHFHQDLVNTLKTLEGGGIQNFSKNITHCLLFLNDRFSECFENDNVIEALNKFSTLCGFETTNEGNVKRKADLSFSFLDKNGNSQKIYCEPHIKIGKSYINGDSKFYFNRIYFYLGKDDIANGAILVGHIGKHL